MSETSAPGHRWLLPVLLAVSTSAALGLGFLYLVRPGSGEIGAIRVSVTADDGKSGNSIRIVVAEAPLVQSFTVSPRKEAQGVVHYPTPYLTKPHLKLSGSKRQYTVLAETEQGFTWAAHYQLDDIVDATPGDRQYLDAVFGEMLRVTVLRNRLKPDLVFEDFTWEARGLRAPPAALPRKTHEQKGTFYTLSGEEAPVSFPQPYESPPNVELSGPRTDCTIVVESTAKGFKWRNNKPKGMVTWEGQLTWTARGVLPLNPEK